MPRFLGQRINPPPASPLFQRLSEQRKWLYGYLRHYHGTNVSGERQRAGPGHGRSRRRRPWGTFWPLMVFMRGVPLALPAEGCSLARGIPSRSPAEGSVAPSCVGPATPRRRASPGTKNPSQLHLHGTTVPGERQRPGAVVPWSTSGAGPQVAPKVTPAGHSLF